MLPLLEEAAKSVALAKFEEVQESLAEEASWDQVHALVSSDQLAARSEEAVFEALVRYAEAQRPEEERLLALMRHVRFPLMRPARTCSAHCACWPCRLSFSRHHPTNSTLVLLGEEMGPAPFGSGRIGGLGQS